MDWKNMYDDDGFVADEPAGTIDEPVSSSWNDLPSSLEPAHLEQRPVAKRPRSRAKKTEADPEREAFDRILLDLFEQIAMERSELAFNELYERFAPNIRAIVRRFVKTEEDTLDLVQEVFLKVWLEGSELCKVNKNPSAWLYTMAKNRVFSEMRTPRFQSRRLTESFEIEKHQDLFLDGRTPDRELDLRESQMEIRGALRELSPLQRKAIELVYFGGLTQKDAAEKLQVPATSIGNIVHGAILQLRKLLDPHIGEPVKPRPSKKKKMREQQRKTMLLPHVDLLLADIRNDKEFWTFKEHVDESNPYAALFREPEGNDLVTPNS